MQVLFDVNVNVVRLALSRNSSVHKASCLRAHNDGNAQTNKYRCESHIRTFVLTVRQYRVYRPITELVSACDGAAKAQIHGVLPGTWNLEKLHVELKYFGTNGDAARLKQRDVKTSYHLNAKLA